MKIDLFPYGGCSKFDVDVNVPLWQELVVLIMGPLMQVFFIYGIQYVVDNTNFILFERYSLWILCFNMLPIYPLDGGKLINLVLSRFISYYKACQITIYISYFIFLFCLLMITFFDFHLVLFLIFVLLGINLFREMRNVLFYYHRFLVERYINTYKFKYFKSVSKLEMMRRDTVHVISNMSEKEYLKKYFTVGY